MTLVLGMDTGGTYTDGVIVNTLGKDIICKAKALTTKDDLTIGIEDCLHRLQLDDPASVQMVCLSTTLATNAIVEGRGSEVGLIYMGYDEVENVPAEVKIKVRGKFDVMGHMIEDIDPEEIAKAVKQMENQVKAIVVSGYASVRNPKHEQQVQEMISRITDIPVVCAHQLTSALGFEHRTVTAVLNARLIHIIDDLIRATKQVLCENGIMAPIMIVKGDGTLMTENLAKERPIETILSGPAASVIGGLALTGQQDGLIMDMGGTTTDLACVKKGKVEIRKEGAKVGGWNTRVQAIEMSTFGIGGDSRIYLDGKGSIVIGPEKVMPLCIGASAYPNIITEIKSYRRKGDLKRYYDHETECFIMAAEADLSGLNEEETAIAEEVRDRAHSLSYIGRKIGKDPEIIDINSLVEQGILRRIGLTPTDLLHVTGDYVAWEKRASYAAIEVMRARLDISSTSLVKTLVRDIRKKLAMTAIQSTMDFADAGMTAEDGREAMYLIDRAFRIEEDSILGVKVNIKKPIVALGAPAGKWLRSLENFLNTKIIVPENADVANAYGAAVGQMIQTVRLEILPDDDKFILNMPWERIVYNTKAEAMFYAIHEGRKHVEHMLLNAGIERWHIEETVKDKRIEIDDNHNTKYIGTEINITGTATGI